VHVRTSSSAPDFAAELLNAAPQRVTQEMRLEENLRALTWRNPRLAERLCWAVDGRHVNEGTDGRLMLQMHQSRVALELSPPDTDEACRQVLASSDRPDVFVFGVGAGELIAQLLASGRVGRVTAWDRDPWMLRLALSRFDLRSALRSGQLRLALGCDLFSELAPLPTDVVLHPVLAPVYRNERQLLEGLRARCAFVGAGGLFVDDLADGLRAQGFSVFTLETERLSLEELDYTVEQLRPAMVTVINYTEGLAEFCDRHQLPLYCWEIDPTLVRLQTLAGPAQTTRIFTYRRAHVQDFLAAGFPHAEFLPLAANPVRRRPATLTKGESLAYRVPIAFVGASLVDRVPRLREDFALGYASFHALRTAGEMVALRDDGLALLDWMLAEQRRDFSRYVLPELFATREPALWAEGKRPGAVDLEQIAGELAAGEKRQAYVEVLAPLGVNVWGDHGWEREGARARYRGSAGHFVELNKIYTAAQVNLDVGRLYQMDIVTMRVFDVLACGGFLLAERADALLEFFTPGVHLDVFTGAQEMVDKAAYYLAHPEAAEDIAQAGRALVRESHTIVQRLQHMLGAAR
jgi:spore maturation protein CgeB